MSKKAYWIGRVEVTNPEAYKRYAEKNGVAFKKYGARFLVRGGAFEIGEGGAKARNVVIEFPSYEAARECYHSVEYRAAIAERQGAAYADIIIIEGYDGPQPS